jgi:hypothetical protein
VADTQMRAWIKTVEDFVVTHFDTSAASCDTNVQPSLMFLLFTALPHTLLRAHFWASFDYQACLSDFNHDVRSYLSTNGRKDSLNVLTFENDMGYIVEVAGETGYFLCTP